MIDKAVLHRIAHEVLTELGLRKWRVWYADAEPETLVGKLPAPLSAANLRFHLHADDGETAHIIRVRVASDMLAPPLRRDAEIRAQLQAGLRRAHFQRSTH